MDTRGGAARRQECAERSARALGCGVCFSREAITSGGVTAPRTIPGCNLPDEYRRRRGARINCTAAHRFRAKMLPPITTTTRFPHNSSQVKPSLSKLINVHVIQNHSAKLYFDYELLLTFGTPGLTMSCNRPSAQCYFPGLALGNSH